MSTNKLSHLKEWEKIYLEVTREKSIRDDDNSLCFGSNCNYSIWANDNDTFYTLDDLKKLTNDGMPKQGDEVYIKTVGSDIWRKAKFIAFYEWKMVVDIYWLIWTTIWKLQPQKTELTLAEIEEKLGIEKGSLIIK